MKAIKYLRFLFIFLIFFSCGKKEKYYYSTGELLSVVEFDSQGENHGYLKEYYKTGELYVVGNYTHGMKDGDFIEYFKSGKLKSKKTFQNDIWIDTLKIFYEEGTIKEMNYLDGYKNKVILYNKNDKVSAEGEMIDTLKIGWWYYFSNNGKLKSKIEYQIQNNTQHRNQIYSYNNEGVIIKDSSNFYTIKVDTLKVKTLTKIELKVQPHLSKENDFYMVYYKFFDNKKNLIEIDSTYGTNSESAIINYFPKIKGNQKLKGFILEKGIFVKENIQDSTMIDMSFHEKKMYFEKMIYVE